MERVRGLPAHPRGSKKGMTGELMQVYFNLPFILRSKMPLAIAVSKNEQELKKGVLHGKVLGTQFPVNNKD